MGNSTISNIINKCRVINYVSSTLLNMILELLDDGIIQHVINWTSIGILVDRVVHRRSLRKGFVHSAMYFFACIGLLVVSLDTLGNICRMTDCSDADDGELAPKNPLEGDLPYLPNEF